MPLHAVEDVEDAYSVTKSFLLPFDRSRWLKLAVVAFLVGGPGFGLTGPQANVTTDGGDVFGPGAGPGPGPLPSGFDLGTDVWLVVAGVVAGAVVLGLAALLVGSVMEFVLVESLRSDEVTVRRYWRRRWRQGLRLFGFRLAVALVGLGATAFVAALVLFPVLTGGAGTVAVPGGLSILLILLLVPAALLLAVILGLVNGLTTVFVVPVMVLEDCGVLAGWRRLWPSIAANPWQYGAYVVVSVLLTVVAGIVFGIAVAIGAFALAIPFGILGGLGFLLLSSVQPVGVALIAVAAVLFALSVVLLGALVKVPVVAYLRYYALLVLGDLDPSLDLIPERRTAARARVE